MTAGRPPAVTAAAGIAIPEAGRSQSPANRQPTSQKLAGAKALTWSFGLLCFNTAGTAMLRVCSDLTPRIMCSAGTDGAVSMYSSVSLFLYIKLVIVFLVLLGNTSCVRVSV